MPIRRITAQKCSTRRVDSLRGRRYHDATISKPERSHPVGYQTLIFERAGAVATITLNRPDARNALDFVMRGELAAVLDEIEADEAARVVILTGAGGNCCSGGDVKTMRAKRHTAAEGRARVESLNRMVLRLVDFPKPTIAMVDGYAVGAGSNLALCCDLIIASDRAKFGELFWKIGLVPDGGGTWLLSRVIGMARAKELIFTAEIIDAAEAGRIRLVNRVVPVAKRPIEGQQHEWARPVARDQRAREMKGIECSERFEGERAAGAADDLIVEAHEAPPTRRRGEQRVEFPGLGFRKVSLDGGADDRTITFDEREVGHDHTVAARDDAPDFLTGWLAEEPGEDRARICVHVQRSARTSSSRRWSTPGARRRLRRGGYARASVLRRVIEPRRTSSAKVFCRPFFRGGVSSATTRPRSVIAP